MTLTALGLSLRDETLVKSLLSVVSRNTNAEWRFVDEIDADLALCDPQSPFARMAMQKSERTGRPSCVALLYGQDSAGPMTRSIRAPLRVGEFVELLDAISDPGRIPPIVVADTTDHDVVPVSAPPYSSHASGQWLADVLRSLIAAGDPTRLQTLWRIEIGGFSLDILLPERRYVLRDPEMTIDTLVDLALSTHVSNVMRVDREDIDAPRKVAITKPLDPLLWRIGLRMTPDPALPWLGNDVALRLSRWPDFGHLGAQKAHLGLAALLTKTSWRIDALLETSGLPRAELQSFLGACGLCGLLIVEKVAPLALVSSVPMRRPGVSGLFRSLRSALRIGG